MGADVTAPRRRVTVQSATTASDAYGGTTRTWATLKELDAVLTPPSDQRFERAGLLGEVTTRVALIPAGLSVTPELTRVVDGTVTYRVLRVTDTPAGTTLLLEAMQ